MAKASLSKLSLYLAVSAGAYFVGEAIAKHGLSANQAVQLVCDQFKPRGPIIGTWVMEHAMRYPDQSRLTYIYHGGFRQQVGYDLLEYEFIVDRKTGEIIKVAQIETDAAH